MWHISPPKRCVYDAIEMMAEKHVAGALLVVSEDNLGGRGF